MRMIFPHTASTGLMNEFASDVGTLVESLFSDNGDSTRLSSHSMGVAMDVHETDSQYRVVLDVPGVPQEAIEIDVHEDTLSISGNRDWSDTSEATKSSDHTDEENSESTAKAESNELRTLRAERGRGSFMRKIRLPLAIEPDSVSAELSDGVLTITLPKADPDRGKRRIEVKRGQAQGTLSKPEVVTTSGGRYAKTEQTISFAYSIQIGKCVSTLSDGSVAA